MRRSVQFWCIALMPFCGAIPARGQSATPASTQMAVMIEAPPPDLSQLRQHQGEKGSGLFRLHIDRATGRVTSVDVRKSTGSAFLDQLTVQTFLRWRAKPHGSRTVNVPITYTGRYP
jgi:TonB family protein